MYKEKVQTGELVIQGTKDVLTLSLGTDEHGGRVRGEGRVTQTNYFQLVRRGPKKHTRQLEALLAEEREKRKEEEEKRKDYESEVTLLKEKVKQLEEGRSSHHEKIASNSLKSDNRPYFPPTVSEEAQSPRTNRKQSQVSSNYFDIIYTILYLILDTG